MRRISSSTLFRFVNKFEYLIDILDNGFSPRYSYEEFPTSTDKIKYRFGIPMICFCDIRLTQAKEHMERYGHFGIGMTETWRKHNRLNPVLYIEKHSLVTENLKKLHSVLYDTINKDKNSLRPLLSPFIEILRYSKPIKKTVMNNNGKKTIIYYYDEREWRSCQD